MQSVSFKINSVENGWFEAEFSTISKRTAVSASDKWGNDAPTHLIKIVNQLLSGKTTSGYITLDEIPGTYVLFFDYSGDNCLLYIFYTSEETCHWKEMHTYGEMTLSEFLGKIPVKELLFFSEIDLTYLAESLYKAFDFYTEKKHLISYEENWNPFPAKEFNKLETLIQNENYSSFKYITA